MHWLDRYSSDYHKWRVHINLEDTKTTYYRRIGIVEGFFDTDGVEFEGRADLNGLLTVNVTKSLSNKDRRTRILHSWATLRLKHVLLGSRALSGHEMMLDGYRPDDQDERYFVIEPPSTETQILQEAQNSISFVEDYYPAADPAVFYRHIMNTARCFDPKERLAHLFVLPISEMSSIQYKFVFVIGHQVADGLSLYAWMASFTNLLNLSLDVRSSWRAFLDPDTFCSRLPKAQEDLYPKVHITNQARQRWYWLVARILRHIHHPTPRSFINPLARPTGTINAHPMPPTFAKMLNYERSRTPPLNSFVDGVSLSAAIFARLRRICKELGVSIGAGAFTLVGMSMMGLREQFPLPQDADKHLTDLPFVGSFPINARSFFNYAGPPESLMLAFSEGIVLPFLPSSLPAEARFRLLVRQADRQLGLYQKGIRAGNGAKLLGALSPSQIVPGNYLAHIERAEIELKEDTQQRRKLAGWRTPQGMYEVKQRNGIATCGVSSVGNRDALLRSMEKQGGGEGQSQEIGWKVELVDFLAAVRVRDGEFLVNSYGDDKGLHFSVSYDGCTLDEKKLGAWRKIIGGLLDPDSLYHRL
ncbi:hypothetical protein FH972_023151 [Carpinus fangiana]|uniref:Condensation domain-containing protein n=1 Tax=Carpinus fangiana TaxID=176857 RepID=A0A5N6KUU7_9ROSI|nr:hypothetical protein FH972_023151 [Carpinus fangiana]